MSDNESYLTPLEKIQSRHRKEKKELQAKVSKLKKCVNKDKKKKKQISEEIAGLEATLLTKHTQELAQFDNQNEVLTICEDLDGAHIQCNEDATGQESNLVSAPKVTKAEQRRKKKADAARERQNRIKEGENSNVNCARKVETEKLKQKLKRKGLRMHEINPDGDCLFAAISHQLDSRHSVQDLRSLAVTLIRDYKDDYAPFLIDLDTGLMRDSDEQFETYCEQMTSTSSWGGQPELRALSQSLKRKIEVIQAEGTPIVFGDEYTDEPPILLPYYLHYCELGEHYNSVLPLHQDADT